MRSLELLIVLILSISFVSAIGFDNVKDSSTFKKGEIVTIGDKQLDYRDLWDKYKPLEINNAFGLGKTLLSGAIDKHTESCGEDCYSTIRLYLGEDSPLIEDIRFYSIRGASKTEKIIEEYNILIQTGEQEITVDDYSYQCINEGFSVNGSAIRVCSNTKVGSHIETIPLWDNYDLGEIKEIGTYHIKITGKKESTESIDWQIKTQGLWIDEWAVWSGTDTLFYNNSLYVSGANSSNGAGSRNGIKIKVAGSNIYITGIEKRSYDEASHAVIEDGSHNHIINTTFNGSIATFNNINLAPNTEYYLMGWNATAWNAQIYLDGLPKNFNYLNMTGGWNAGDNTHVYSIAGIYFRLDNSSYITLNSPADNYSAASNVTTFNATATTIGATLVNMSLWTNETGTWGLVNSTTGLSGNSYTAVWTRALPNGKFNWGVRACDSDGTCGFSQNRTVTIDSSTPVVTIHLPTNKINYGYLGKNETLNYSVVDTGTLNNCWYNHNGTNNIISCTNNASFLLGSYANRTITVYGNDTSGNVGSASISWNYTIWEDSISYSSSEVETSLSSFTNNITYDPAYTFTASRLNYNNTDYLSSTTSSGYNVTLSNSITLPEVNGSTAYNFRYNISLTNSTGTFYFLSPYRSQIVTDLFFSVCNTTINKTVINITTYSATSPYPLLNTSMYSTWSYWVGSGATKLNYTFQNNSQSTYNFQFCSTSNTTNYKIDADIQFTATGYSQNYHYYRDKTVNGTAILQQPIYMLNSSLATLTQLKVINNLQTGVADQLIYIRLYDVGTGTYRTIGMAKTNYNGEDIVYLNWYDSLYQFTITDSSNVVVGSFDPYKVASTPQTFRLGVTNVFPLDKFNNVTHSLTFNNLTKTFILTYNDPTLQITGGCLKVVKFGGDNYDTLYDYCNAGTSGTITYTVTAGNGTYFGIFYAQGSYTVIDVISAIVGSLNEIFDLLGNLDATVMALIIVGTSAFIGLFSPVGGVLFAIVGYILSIALGFIPFTSIPLFVGIVLVGGYLMWKLRN